VTVIISAGNSIYAGHLYLGFITYAEKGCVSVCFLLNSNQWTKLMFPCYDEAILMLREAYGDITEESMLI